MRTGTTTPTRRSLASTDVAPPRPKQLEAIKFCLARGAAGVFADPGLGKTRIALTVARVLLEKKLVHRWLVVSPLRPLYATWPAEMDKWHVDLSFTMLHGDTKNRELRTKHEVGLINYDGLSWLARQPEWKQYDGLILDESTKVKHADTQRFKLLRGMLGNFKRRYILTGTPAPNGLMDLFGQAYVLDYGEALGRYITHYRNNFFVPTGYGGYTWVPVRGAEERIYDRLAELCIRLANDDMPELIIDPIVVTLPPSARKVYDELDELLITQIDEGEVTAANVAVATQKCRQVASGNLYLTDGETRTWKHLHDAKTEALVDLVEQLQGSPLLVGYEFKHELEALRKHKAFKDWPVVGGGMKPREMVPIQADFNAGRIPGILAQIEAAAHGLNLQEGPGHHVAAYSLTWDLEAWDQFIRRIWRPGQASRHVYVHPLVAKDTVDQDMIGALSRKAKTQNDLLRALLERHGR